MSAKLILDYSKFTGGVQMKKTVFRSRFYLTLFLLFLTFISSITNGQQVLTGHVPSIIKDLGLKPISHLDSTMQLSLTIGLPFRNQTELTNLINDIYNPASSSYRHYLSVADFTTEFGATAQDCQAVSAFAKANNLFVTKIFPNNLLIDVQGKEADIESALHVKLLVYNHPTENRTFFASDRDPSINLKVPILQISGLDSYPSIKSCYKPSNNSKEMVTSQGTGSCPNGSYMGNDFRKAYNPGDTLKGGGQVVGLLEFGGYYTDDINYYEQKAGLPNVTLTNIPVDGGSGPN